jgi:hypothetical protein
VGRLYGPARKFYGRGREFTESLVEGSRGRKRARRAQRTGGSFTGPQDGWGGGGGFPGENEAWEGVMGESMGGKGLAGASEAW